MSVKVTIIIATYNAEKTLRQALQSICKQTFQDWECLIIDGKSTDKTLSIAQEFTHLNNKIHIYSEPDLGIFDAFNKGWKKAKGEWIYYLGSDDELLPEGLNQLMAHSTNADFVYGGIAVRYKSGKIKHKKPGFFEQTMPFSLATSHQAMIVKRTKIEEVGGFNLKYKILSDYDLINNIYYKGIKSQRCESCIAIFKLGGVSTDNISSLCERYEILTKYGVSKPTAFLHCMKMGIFFLILKVKHFFD